MTNALNLTFLINIIKLKINHLNDFKKMPLNLMKIYDICKSGEALLNHLQEWSLVPRIRDCPQCSGPMTLYNCNEDGWRWRCRNKISFRKQAAKLCDQKIGFRNAIKRCDSLKLDRTEEFYRLAGRLCSQDIQIEENEEDLIEEMLDF